MYNFCLFILSAVLLLDLAPVKIEALEARPDKEKDRLSCLQGDQSSAGKWKRQTIFGDLNPDAKHWTFQPDNCPLKPFDVDAFCRIALRCQNMLMVGDSTVESLYHAGSSLLSGKHKENEHIIGPPEMMVSEITRSIPCPAKYDHLATSKRPEQQNLMYERHVCRSSCPAQLKLTYVRHEMLVGHIGPHSADRQCDHWQELLDQYPIQYYSLGPHVPQIVESNKGVANMSQVFQNHAAAFVSILTDHEKRRAEREKRRQEEHEVDEVSEHKKSPLVASILSINEKRRAKRKKIEKRKHDEHTSKVSEHTKRPLIIYETGRWGSLDFTEKCEPNPLKDVQPPNTSHGKLVKTVVLRGQNISIQPFHWGSIAALNSAVLKELENRIPKDILLTLNTANVTSMRQGCRVDWLHYQHPKFSYSPDWRTWQLLWNLLESESQVHQATTELVNNSTRQFNATSI